MGTRIKTTLAKQLKRAQLAIYGTLQSPEILTAVTVFGYDEPMMREGETLFLAVQNHRNRTSVKRGSKAQTNQKASGTENIGRKAYSSLATVVRALFVSDPAARTALGLAGRSPDSRAAFIATAETLFAACLGASPELKAKLARFGYPESKLISEQAKIAALRAEMTAQAGAKGDSEQETLALHHALNGLNAWVMQYRKLARLALANQPQLLEKIGIGIAS